MAATRMADVEAERNGTVSDPSVVEPSNGVGGLDVVDDPPPVPVLADGTDVEVRRRFDRAWARGFVVESHASGGYRLRRSSDGAVLPVAFPAADVRAATGT